MKICFCGSDKPFSRCCGPIIQGNIVANSAEKLMRSRYSACVICNADYLIATTHISKRSSISKKEVEQWAKANSWHRLEILHSDTFTVEFKAYFRDRSAKQQVHHEQSTFVFEEENWYYLDGVFGDEIKNESGEF